MASPLVSIVILNWNGQKFLDQFLPSVIGSTYANKEIVVVDNASTDNSVQWLQQHFPQVKIVQLSQNLGYAKGYNEGLKQVKADYYVLLNSDVEVAPGWIEPVIALMEQQPQIAACQPKLLQFTQRSYFEYAGASGGWIDYLGYPFARGRVFDVCEEDKGQYDDNVSVFWASGAALFVRAGLFHKIGGFDEYFFAHQEEIDFCWRLQLAGYEVYCCPQSVVYHVGGGTLPKGNSRKVFLNFRNNLIMLAKNLTTPRAWLIIPSRFVLDAVSAIKSLFVGEVAYCFAVFKAHFAFLNWLIFHKKRPLFPSKRLILLKGCWAKSVVWSYFVQGKKTFSEILGQKN